MITCEPKVDAIPLALQTYNRILPQLLPSMDENTARIVASNLTVAALSYSGNHKVSELT